MSHQIYPESPAQIAKKFLGLIQAAAIQKTHPLLLAEDIVAQGGSVEFAAAIAKAVSEKLSDGTALNYPRSLDGISRG